MTFPGAYEIIESDFIDATAQPGVHAPHHNQLARILNAVEQELLALASGASLTSPHMTGAVVDSGGLRVTAGGVGIGQAASATAGLIVAAGAATDAASRYGIYVNTVSGGSTANMGIRATGGTPAIQVDTGGLMVVAGQTQLNDTTLLGSSSLVAGSTTGFAHVASPNAAPTGSPTLVGGYVPFYFAYTTQRLWAYLNGAWRSVALA